MGGCRRHHRATYFEVLRELDDVLERERWKRLRGTSAENQRALAGLHGADLFCLRSGRVLLGPHLCSGPSGPPGRRYPSTTARFIPESRNASS